MSLQQGNLRREGDALIVSCTYPDCPWSAPLGTGATGPWNQSAVFAEAEEKLHAHLEALHPEPAAPALTSTELEALDLSGKLADLLSQVVAPGPTAAQDTAELHHHVHAIQRYVGSQAAARAYPERFRLLGDVGAWNRSEP